MQETAQKYSHIKTHKNIKQHE